MHRLKVKRVNVSGQWCQGPWREVEKGLRGVVGKVSEPSLGREEDGGKL